MESSEQALAIWSVLSDDDKSPWSLSQISEDLKKDSTDYFFVYNDGEVIGFLALQQLVGEEK
ncbi:hypothetical protein SAG0214_09270 [Streptococcus agalactiae str. Gottschalk 992B]|nr:hypothetical protein SAG0214_09270 [Streptococcus agalactiae str. Gottschalk 992B]